MDEVRIDYDRVDWMKDQIDAAARSIHLNPNMTANPVDTTTPSAFGNTSGASFCYGAWRDVSAEIVRARSYLALSLEADVGRLDTVMYTFRHEDADAADQIIAASFRSDTLDVYNTHLATNATDREEQADTAIDVIEDGLVPAIFAGDMNTESLPGFDRLEDRGWNDVGVDATGGQIPTSAEGNAIDKVYASPGIVVTNPAQPVEGEPSDHDSIVVDLAVAPPWP